MPLCLVSRLNLDLGHFVRAGSPNVFKPPGRPRVLFYLLLDDLKLALSCPLEHRFVSLYQLLKLLAGLCNILILVIAFFNDNLDLFGRLPSFLTASCLLTVCIGPPFWLYVHHWPSTHSFMHACSDRSDLAFIQSRVDLFNSFDELRHLVLFLIRANGPSPWLDAQPILL